MMESFDVEGKIILELKNQPKIKSGFQLFIFPPMEYQFGGKIGQMKLFIEYLIHE